MAFQKTRPWGNVKPPVGSVVNWGDPINTGLQACWLFNEGAGLQVSDIARTTDGVLNSTQIWVNGRFGRALSFAGTSTSYVSLNNTSHLNLSGNFTIGGWAKWTGGTPNYNPVISRWNAAGTIGYGISLNPTYNVRVDSYNTTGTNTNSTRTLTTGVWYYVIGVNDGTTLKVYVNGVLEGSTGSVINPGDAGVAARIGDDRSVGGRVWTGLLDNIRIYSRDLSGLEIWRLYTDPFAGIVAPKLRIGRAGVVAAASRNNLMLLGVS